MRDHSHSGAGHTDDDDGCHGDPVGIHGYHSSDSCLAHDSDEKGIEAGCTLTTPHSMVVGPSLPRSTSAGHFDHGQLHHTVRVAGRDRQHHG